MNENLISVIIPVYNTAEYLPRCLESVLNNTYRNLEVICVNDGSKDNSLEVLYAYTQKDTRIRVIDQENAGVSAARNRGLDEAIGEYIAFVDSDDWVHRQYFEVLLSNIIEHDAHISICGYTMITQMEDAPELTPDQVSASFLTHVQLAEKDIPSWGRLFFRESIGSIRFDPSVTLAEDTVFSLENIRRNPELKLCRCDAPMYYYFTRENSLVHTLPNRKFAPLIRYYLECVSNFGNCEMENVCLVRACKTMFLWRYRARFQDDPVGDDELRDLLKRARAELWKAKGLTLQKKCYYLAMAHFPMIYRVFRILNDPTMLAWEKQQRKKTLNKKTKS